MSVASLGIAFSGPATARALDPSTVLANYARQAWVMENGLPQNTVTAVIQTRDGFVWLGTEVGLVRFDGVAFQVFDRTSIPALPSGDIRCLLAAGDGTLWIGTSAGLVQWKNGSVRVFTTADGLPANGILALVTVESGAVGAWTEQGPAQQAGDRFEAVRNVDGFPHTALPSPGEYPGAIAFEEELPGGILVMGDRNSLDFLRGRERPRSVLHLSVGRELPGSRIQAVFVDREGTVWIGANSGLVRWVRGRIERFPVTDALATASILAIMEDREGDLWVGTEAGGLHILRDQRFRIIGARDGLASDATTAVVEDKDGALWVGTQGAGLSALTRSSAGQIKATAWTLREGLMSDLILSLAAAPKGDVWVGTPDGLNRLHGKKVDAFTSADGLPDDFIRSLLVDTDKSLWIGTRRGLVHWINPPGSANAAAQQPRMTILTQANGLGSDTVGALVRDKGDNLWVATLGGLSRLRDGSVSNYTTANGLSSNVVTALLPLDDGTLLIGTQDRGWNLWNGKRFVAVSGGGLDQLTIHAILDDTEGHLWFATSNGIARCDWSGAAGANPGVPCSHWLTFGTADGLHSRETAANSHPSATRSQDGHLWFATPRGLVEVDPAHFPVNSVDPPVAVERFAVDDLDQAMLGSNAPPKIAAGHVHFEFDYAGLSYTAPLKVRYRYRLEGFDRDWTDAGTRRTAYYTNIPPGHYTFRVQAANNDGVWNTTGAAISFELKPHFYQTLWFYALLLLAMGASVVLMIQSRLRTARREFRAVLGERSRIAREIHDTLAQGYVGISVQLEMLAELLRQRNVETATEHLNKTREYVREGLADARQSIWALRTQDAEETTLPVKVRRLAEAAGDDGLTAQFSVFGAYRPLPPGTELEILRIAQEAIHNVKKHAGAQRLTVQLKYEPAAIELEVSDDGRGAAADQMETPAQGGFGLTGMRERAAAIRGTLVVNSVTGAGTTVRLRAPAPAREQTGEPE
ncbi:MAG: two-component regulator propeller domain-containing protein [Terracidiphilus sp.]|jgi:signal transduction histidine kinase/ligand-binding sensor domain-containing protein